MFLGSEIENFHTRYMATVTGGIAVLFTFSIHKSQFKEFDGALTLATQTLKVSKRIPSAVWTA
jgi:hypothetical protein